MQWHLEINFNIISKENFHIGMPHIDVLGLWCVFTSRASVGGETEWVKEKGHMVMLGRILDLSKQGLVKNKRTTKMVMVVVVVVVVAGVEE